MRAVKNSSINRLCAISSAVCCALSLVTAVHAEQTGATIVGGTGTITQAGTTTTINQATQNMAINWQSYNVNANERVQYIQPNASSISLNRILSNSGSTIAGRIDANGQVILVNPNGVYFTPTAQINVGGIIASGLDIKPTDFMNGNYIFNEVLGSDGGVINSGTINASLGGNVALIGRHVENNGLISANLGTVNLAAGKEAVLTFDNGGVLGVRVSKEILQSELGVDPAVLNSGTINAEGGKVLLTASVSKDVFSQAVNTNGIQPATSVVVNPDGTYTLGGGADVVNTGTIDTSTTNAAENVGRIILIGDNVTSSGVLKADAANGNGGEVELNSTNMTLLTQNSVTSARSESNGNGGIVKVLGSNNVGLFDQSKVDVSGANGGGQALIGGDLHGTNPQINNATKTIIDRSASIFTDAIENGNGGKAIVWADNATAFLGNIYARGGAGSGNGGFVEVSGKRNLYFTGLANTKAINGLNGTLLLDPQDLTISTVANRPTGLTDITSSLTNGDPSARFVFFGEPNSTTQTADSTLGWISDATLVDQLGNGSVTLQANNTIKFIDSVDVSAVGGANGSNLTLNAGNSIYINAGVTIGLNHGNFIATINDSRANSNNRVIVDNPTTTTVNEKLATFSMASGSSIVTNGGSIQISTGTFGGANAANYIGDITLTTLNTTPTSGTYLAGSISVTNDTGNINVNTLLQAAGRNRAAGSDNNGGDGNSITLTATTGSINVAAASSISANGGKAGGTNNSGGAAGNITLTAGTDIIVNNSTTKTITANGGDAPDVNGTNYGNGGQGGQVVLNATRDLSLGMALTANGGFATGNGSGGNEVAGNGGAIYLISGRDMQIGAAISSNGGDTNGDGATAGDAAFIANNNYGINFYVGRNFSINAGISALAGTLGGTGSTGSNELIVINGGDGTAATNNLPVAANTFNVNTGASFSGLSATIYGNGGGDTFNINSMFSGGTITTLNVVGSLAGTTNDTLAKPDTATTVTNDWQITGNGSGILKQTSGTNSNQVVFSGISNLTGGAGNDSFVRNTAAGPTVGQMRGLIDGGGGSDTFTINSTVSNATTIHLFTSPISLQSSADSFAIYRVGTLTNNSTGLGTLFGPPDVTTTSTWNINAETNNTTNLSTLKWSTITANPPDVNFYNFSVLYGGSGGTNIFNINNPKSGWIINAGLLGDTFNVFADFTGTAGTGVLNGGAGNDSFNIKNSGLSVTSMVGNGGINTVTGPDSASVTNIWTVTTDTTGTSGTKGNGSLNTGTALVPISANFTGMSDLVGGTGVDNFTVDAGATIRSIDTKNGLTNSVIVNGAVTGATGVTAITGGTGVDTITVNGTVGSGLAATATAINSGGENDFINVGGSVTGVIDGGGNGAAATGDTLTVTANNKKVQLGGYNVNNQAVDYVINNFETVTGAGDTGSTLISAAGTANTWTIGGTGNTVNTINFTNFANIQGGSTSSDGFTVNAATGIASLANTVTGLNTGNGPTTSVTVNSGAGVTSITTGTGSNTISIAGVNGAIPIGSVGSIAMGSGANTIDIYGSVTGAITELVTTSTGVDNIHVYAGGTAGNITTGAGADSVTVDAATTLAAATVGTINVGNGANTVNIAGTSGAITGGTAGTNNITVSGTVSGDIKLGTGATGDGVETVNVTGTGIVKASAVGATDGGITTGSNNDNVTVDGKAVYISAGAGNDTITIASPAVITGVVPATTTGIAGGAQSTTTGDTLIVNTSPNTWAFTSSNADGNTGSVSNTVGNATSTVNFSGIDSYSNLTGSTGSVLDLSGLTTVAVNLNVSAGFSTVIGNNTDSTLTGVNGATNNWYIGITGYTGTTGTNNGVNDGVISYTTTASPTATNITFIDFNKLIGGAAINTGTAQAPVYVGSNNFYLANAPVTGVPTDGVLDGSITGGANAANTLTARNLVNDWSLNAASGGGVTYTTNGAAGGTYTTNFAAMQYLVGGNQNDTFAFTNTAAVDSFTNIDGKLETGRDVADFSTLAGAVNLNLGSTRYTSIEGFIGNNNANSTITGADLPNTWDIAPVTIRSVLYSNNSGTVNTVISFANFPKLVGGSGNDDFIIGPNVSGSVSGTGLITGSIDGGLGTNTLTGRDGSNTWLISGNNSGSLGVTGGATYVTSFSRIQNLVGGSGADDFYVGPYNNGSTINITGTGSIGTITGGTGNNSLTGRDGSNTWSITGANTGSLGVTNSTAAYVTTFSQIQKLIGGSGNDIFTFSSGTPVVVPILASILQVTMNGGGSIDTIDGGAGVNTLIGRSEPATLVGATTVSGSNVWTISGANSGSVTDSVTGVGGGTILPTSAQYVTSFANIQNLTGGSANDAFNLTTASSSLSGLINGAGGTDTVTTTRNINVQLYAPAVTAPTVSSTNTNIIAVFDVDSVVATGTTSTLTGPAAANTWTITGTNSGNVNNLVSFTDFVNLTGGTGASNTFDFSTSNFGSISGLITGGAGVGTNTINGRNNASTWTINNAGAGTVRDDVLSTTANQVMYVANFTGIQKLVGGTGADNFTFATTTGTITTIDGGITGTNTITGRNADTTWTITNLGTGSLREGVQATASPVYYVTQFSNIQSLVGGSSADNFTFATATTGSMDSINGGTGTNTLLGSNTNTTWTINGANGGTVGTTGSTSVTPYVTAFSNIQNLTGGSGNDIFNLTSVTTPASTGSLSGLINGGGGATNTLNVALNDITVQLYDSVVTVNNSAAISTIAVTALQNVNATGTHETLQGPNRTGASNWTINGTDSGSVNGVNFTGFGNLTGGTGTDNFSMTAGSLSGVIIGDSADSFTTAVDIHAQFYAALPTAPALPIYNVPPVAPTDINTVALFGLGSVTGTGTGANSTLVGPDGVSNTWFITGSDRGSIRINNVNVTFTNFASLKGGDSADNFVFGPYNNASTINITGLGSISGTIDGGLGSNTITGRDANNTWTLTAANAGSLGLTGAGSSYVPVFSNIQNLTGGSGADRFVMSTGTAAGIPTTGSITGTIDGGSNTGTTTYNELVGLNDNTTWTINGTDAGFVGLTGGAIYVGAFKNIQNLTGGSGGDEFTLVNSIGGTGTTVGQITGTVTGGTFDPYNAATFNIIHALFGRSNTFQNSSVTTAANGVKTFDGRLISNNLNPPLNNQTTDINAYVGIQIQDASGSGIADFSATVGPVNFQLGVSFLGVTSVIGNNTGAGQWDSTLTGYNGVLNTWTISGINSGNVVYTPNTTGGKLTTVTFSGFNNLVGGNASNNFTMQATGAITGYINGGLRATGPTDTNSLLLQWSPTATPSVLASTVDFHAPPAVNQTNVMYGSPGYVYVSNFNTITANAATVNANTVIGSDITNAWSIYAANTSKLNASIANGTDLINFGNLTGGGQADTFTLVSTGNTTGSLAGLISGGGHPANTVDSVIIDSNTGTAVTTPMTFNLIGTAPTAAGQIVNANASILSTYQIDTITANPTVANTLYGVNSTVTTNTWNITGSNGGTVADGVSPIVTFTNFGTLYGSSGSDIFNIYGNGVTNGQLSGTLHTNGGADTFNITMTGLETGQINIIKDVIAASTVTLNILGGATAANTAAYQETYASNVLVNATNYNQFSYVSAAGSAGGSSHGYMVNYAGLQPLVDQVVDTVTAASLVANATNTGDTITLSAPVMAANDAAFWVNSQAHVDFANKQSLILNGQAKISLDSNISLPATLLSLSTAQLTQTTGTTLAANSLLLSNVGAAGTSVTDRIQIAVNNLSINNSGSLYLNNNNGATALNLGGITPTAAIPTTAFNTTGSLDILASGAVNSTSPLVTSAPLAIHTTGDISLTGANSLSGSLSFTGPSAVQPAAGNVSVSNTVATDIASAVANSLTVTNSAGNITDSGVITVNNLVMSTPGNITLDNLVNLTAGNLTANTLTLVAANGIGTVSGDVFTANPNLTPISTTASVIDVTNTTSGVINIHNTGNVTSLTLQNAGDIFYQNNGNVIVNLVNANFGGSGFRHVNAPYAGSVYIGGTGSFTGLGPDFINKPDIVGQNLVARGFTSFGAAGRPISIRVEKIFLLPDTQPSLAYVFYFDGPPEIRPFNLNVFTGLDGLNLQMIEVESLGDVDPAIFTQVKNYYYEDVAILLPEDQRFGDDDGKENKKPCDGTGVSKTKESCAKPTDARL